VGLKTFLTSTNINVEMSFSQQQEKEKFWLRESVKDSPKSEKQAPGNKNKLLE